MVVHLVGSTWTVAEGLFHLDCYKGSRCTQSSGASPSQKPPPLPSSAYHLAITPIIFGDNYLKIKERYRIGFSKVLFLSYILACQFFDLEMCKREKETPLFLCALLPSPGPCTPPRLLVLLRDRLNHSHWAHQGYDPSMPILSLLESFFFQNVIELGFPPFISLALAQFGI
jgi:hypothetical protein